MLGIHVTQLQWESVNESIAATRVQKIVTKPSHMEREQSGCWIGVWRFISFFFFFFLRLHSHKIEQDHAFKKVTEAQSDISNTW